jgi:glycine/D-amino acid oxidase-like deaminating enzyme
MGLTAATLLAQLNLRVTIYAKAFPPHTTSNVADGQWAPSGLGARDIWQDSLVKPVKGQLLILPLQPKLQYLYSGHGYLFPRQDRVVVGGSEEIHFIDDKPDIQI